MLREGAPLWGPGTHGAAASGAAASRSEPTEVMPGPGPGLNIWGFSP